MAAGPDTLLRYVRRLVSRQPQSKEASDAALLDRFISERNETSFAALVDRHGPLVLHVCLRVLGDAHEAEDAFQATFLILARKAATVRPPEALPAWLHVVARRVALKARSAKMRQFCEARPLAVPAADSRPDPLTEVSVRELLLIIDEELDRLARVYRLPLILCCLEGRSLEEAARQLGWTVGSVKGRLERGRARLHARLVRRGIGLSAALAAVEASRSAASAAGITPLLASTVRCAVAFAARPSAEAGGASAGAAALAGQTLRSMAVARLTIAAALLLATALLATGLMMHRAASAPGAETAQARLASVVDGPPGAVQDEADAPIEVRGRVLDPQGGPLAGARLYVGFSVQHFGLEGQFRPMPYPVRTISGPDGRFHFTFTQSELDADSLDHSRPAVIAVAQGYGPSWAKIKDVAAHTQLTLKLAQDFPMAGRVVRRDRQPIAGVRVLVWKIEEGSEREFRDVFQGNACLSARVGCRGPLPEQLPFVTTTADGRFRLTGIGRDRIVALLLEGPGVRPTFVWAATRPRPEARSPEDLSLTKFDYPVPVSRRIRGIVRDKATGRPVAGVKVSAQGSFYTGGSTSLTDNTGAYEILVTPQKQNPAIPSLFAGWTVSAQPEQAQLYFASSATVPDTTGSDPIVVDFELLNGIPLRGRVIEQTGKPSQAAVVEYHPLFPNPHSPKLTNGPSVAASSCRVRPDGSYRLTVLPGAGVVCVAASPRDWYALAMVDEDELAGLVNDGISHDFGLHLRTAFGAGKQGLLSPDRYNVLSLINPGERTELPALDLKLQRSRPITGTVVGIDGQPLSGTALAGLNGLAEDMVLEDASFNVRGLNPHQNRALVFHHYKLGLGKTLIVHGEQTEPLTVQLEPCGSVAGRLVDKGGKPISAAGLGLNARDGRLSSGAQTDQQGRFRAAVVPGRKYWLGTFPPFRLVGGDQAVELKSGQVKDLGDLFVGD